MDSIFKIKSTFYQWGNHLLPPVAGARVQQPLGKRKTREPDLISIPINLVEIKRTNTVHRFRLR